jgi:hypothetical protein
VLIAGAPRAIWRSPWGTDRRASILGVVEVEELLFRGHPEVVDADRAAIEHFHAELLKSVSHSPSGQLNYSTTLKLAMKQNPLLEVVSYRRFRAATEKPPFN